MQTRRLCHAFDILTPGRSLLGFILGFSLLLTSCAVRFAEPPHEFIPSTVTPPIAVQSVEAAAVPDPSPTVPASPEPTTLPPSATLTLTLMPTQTPTPTPTASSTPAVYTDEDELVVAERAQMLELINELRVEEGLAPFMPNEQLHQAAQRHSEYLRDTGEVTHIEAGDADALERIRQTGYPALRVNENIYVGRSPEIAVEWWLSDPPHRHNLLHPHQRAIGIGVASDERGARYYTVNLSSRPNVLPVFINDGAETTESRDVTLTLSNEEIFAGDCVEQIGLVQQVEISNSPDFENVERMAWQRHISWQLATGSGEKTVYVRHTDGCGTSTDSQASIYSQLSDN